MKIIRVDKYEDFGLVVTPKGIDGYLTNDKEVLSGMPPATPPLVNYTGGRFVINNNGSGPIKMGPFVDSSGNILDSLSIVQADVRLSKNDGNFVQKNDSSGATHDENGWYDVPINSTDTNTQGILLIVINKTGALPVWRMFEVSVGDS